MLTLYVNMFGEFSIHTETSSIGEGDNRSRKVWLLLAYLLYHHNRIVKFSELCDLLWSESEKEKNSSSAIKTLVYRLRNELDKLWDGAGKQLILFRNNGYIWNNEEFPVQLDCEKFDVLWNKISQEPQVPIDEAIEMLDLYKGGFLTHYAMEFWVTPNTVYYHNAYISCLLNTLPLLMESGKYSDVTNFCRVAAAVEPFNEEIHTYWIKAYIGLKNYKKAIEIYRDLRDRLLSELGVTPSEETTAAYSEAVKNSNDSELSVDILKESLKEDDSPSGALICELDFFRMLYRSMTRSVSRSGIAVHLALITMRGRKITEQDEKRWKKLINNLEESIRCSTRRGDSAARCSTSQFVVMLPLANYENSCMVCERIIKAFYQKNSRLDTELCFEVFPIQPDDKENLQWIRKPAES